MAFVHNDQVKKVGRKEFAEMLLIIVSNQLLIQRKVHLMRGDGAFIISGYVDLVNYFFQRGKILLNGLIYKDVSIRKIQHLALHSALKQAINDLKSSIGLAGAGRHNEQKPLLTASNCIYGAVNCNSLVIAGRISILAGIIGLADRCLLCWAKSGFPLKSFNQFCLRRKVFQAELALLAGKKVMFRKSVPIGAKCKGKIQHPRILHRLLQSVGDAMGIILGLNDRNRIICT